MKTKNKSIRKFSLVFLGAVIFSIFFVSDCAAIDAWPGGAGTTINDTLTDASGILWHEGRQSLFIVRNSGTLVEIGSDGTFKHSWLIDGLPDLEGITLAENERYLYLGVEKPNDSIIEFDLEMGEGELTGNSWDLTTWMASVDPNQGLEGLAYRGGYFLAGIQEGGLVYIFDVNIDVSDDVSLIDTIAPLAGYTSDVSGIEYGEDTGNAYVIYDAHNALVELNSSNSVVEHYSLPGTAQEGFAMKANCMERKADVYIANDDSGTIVKYTDYPITCLDADSDGVNYTSDCNDYDAAISNNINYYRDADSDGLGANTATAFCSLTAPAGYVTNSSDQNDNDFDNDGSAAGIDCNDADNSISQNQTYYRDADGDGLGDAFTSTESCSLAATLGYVTNSSDPADISGSGRYMTINGTEIDLFGTDVLSAEHADLNYYSDDWHEVIAVGLISKKAYILLVRIKGDEVYIVKRIRISKKKKYTTVSISTDSAKQKFTTRFSRGKKYTWKVASSGSFKKSK